MHWVDYLIIGLGLLTLLGAAIALAAVVLSLRRKKGTAANTNTSAADLDYYSAGNPELGIGPVHPIDGHGNTCDCWSCWSQTHE